MDDEVKRMINEVIDVNKYVRDYANRELLEFSFKSKENKEKVLRGLSIILGNRDLSENIRTEIKELISNINKIEPNVYTSEGEAYEKNINTLYFEDLKTEYKRKSREELQTGLKSDKKYEVKNIVSVKPAGPEKVNKPTFRVLETSTTEGYLCYNGLIEYAKENMHDVKKIDELINDLSIGLKSENNTERLWAGKTLEKLLNISVLTVDQYVQVEETLKKRKATTNI